MTPTGEECWIDEVGPMPIFRPRSLDEAGAVVQRAIEEKQPVFPLGGCSLLHLGFPPARAGLGLSTTDLDQIIDYPARDMTITVGAGITLGRLQQTLKSENQRLPVDIPHPERATLGGMIATNRSGPRRYAFGTMRDYVIGVSIIDDEAKSAMAGGRVVKNVAGYDLCKLHTGALGTLGVITQVTLKLKPLPEESAFVILGCENADLENILEKLSESRTRPACIELLNCNAAKHTSSMIGQRLPESPWVAAIGFEDNSDSVAWQVNQLRQELSACRCHLTNTQTGTSCEPIWRALVEGTEERNARITFKANLLASALAKFCLGAAQLIPELRIQAHAGNGIVIAHIMEQLTLERAQYILSELLNAVTAAHGNLVVIRCASAWKRVLPVWGRTRADVWLMRLVKEKLDPRSIFNPGRFIEGW